MADTLFFFFFLLTFSVLMRVYTKRPAERVACGRYVAAVTVTRLSLNTSRVIFLMNFHVILLDLN